ncbi:hypothetical protein DIPPA_54492 [Diplonema papillatum]|nr:hypothetical protein DIPPA_54492 [Diplonema papillatum]
MTMDEVWPAVLRVLKTKGLEFEDVQLAEDSDREDILREMFPNAPLYRAFANTTWLKLSRILNNNKLQQQQTSPRSPSNGMYYPPQAQQQPLGSPGFSQVSHGNQDLSSLDVWTAFLASLSSKDLQFEDVQHASLDDRWTLLNEVFPTSALWRAQAASFWEQLCPYRLLAKSADSLPNHPSMHSTRHVASVPVPQPLTMSVAPYVVHPYSPPAGLYGLS